MVAWAGPVRRWLPAVVVLLLGGAITWVYHAREIEEDRERVRAALHVRADWQSAAMRSVLRLNLSPVESAAALIGSGERDPGRFDAFYRSLIHYQDVPPDRLGWYVKVTDEERERFEARVRDSGRPSDFRILDYNADGTFSPAGRRPLHFPVLFGAARFGALPGVGFDPMGDPARSVVLTSAGDSAETMLSLARPSLGPEPAGPVVTAYAPVYATPGLPTTIEDRRAALAGFVGGVFPVLALLNTTVRSMPDGVGDVLIADRPFVGDRPVTPIAVFRRESGGFVTGTEPVRASTLAGEAVQRELLIGGQRWQLLIHFRAADLAAMRSSEAWFILAAGFLLTIVVAGYVAAQRHRIEGLVSGLGVRDRQLRETSADLAHSNAWLLAAIDSSPIAMIGLDPDGQVLSWNAASATTFGYSAGEALGRFPPNVPPELEGRARELIGRVCSGETIRNIAAVARKKDGSPLEILISAAPIRAADGRVNGVVVMQVDISEQRRVEGRLRQVVKMEALGQLTGGLAHDFNNLLGIIVGNLDLLRDKIAERPDLLRFVDPPLRAALKGSELNNALLAFSQRQDLEPRRLEIGATISEMAKMLSRTLGEQIVLDVQTPADLWPVVADPAQLSSAILHLAVNARDAMPDGGRLTLTAANVAVDEDMRCLDSELTGERYVCLSVTDTGTGMSPEVISHVFEPFFTTKRDHKGSGLGLAQVLGFAKQSGGTARIYSEIGHGTSVHLYLPCARDDAVVAAEGVRDTTAAPGRGELILVVEDSPPLRDVVVGQLESLGYRPLAVGNGREALEALEARAADLLFTDIVMPGGMDGRQLAAEARAKRPGLRVLFTSGFAGASGPDGSALPGRLLRKPYRMRDLALRVREALDS